MAQCQRDCLDRDQYFSERLIGSTLAENLAGENKGITIMDIDEVNLRTLL